MLAKAIDFMVQGVALIATIFIVAFLAVAGSAAAIIGLVLLLFLIFYGYPILFETLWDGKTLGKRVLGIRVITTEGSPVSFRHSAIRGLIFTIDFWIPATGGIIALFSALLTKRSQRLGDLAAGTIVIRDPKARTSPVFFAPVPGVEAFGQTLDTSRLEAHHYTLIREFLLRANDLQPDARRRVAATLAGPVGEVIHNPPPPWLDAERFLGTVLYAHQARFIAAPGGLPGLPPPTAGMAVRGPAAAMMPGPPAGSGPPAAPGSVDLSTLPPPTGRPVG